jgi:hypothetical protein
LPVQLGAHVPHTANSGGKHVVPPVHVGAHAPPHPSSPPHFPAQLGVHSPPSPSDELLAEAAAPGGVENPVPTGVVDEHA